MERKDKQINIRLSAKERALIEKRMKEMGIKNMSAFMLKMALNGYCVKLDLKDLKELLFLLRMCSNNLNQYAKKANATGNIYLEDVSSMKAKYDELIQLYGKVLHRFNEIGDAIE